jgi:pyridoxal phosphate enzyme (YggS family)
MAEKAAALADLPLSWHFIGPIQSNKTAVIAEVSDWVHSVDRLKIARRLSEQRPEDKGPLNVLVQVKTSSEDSKSGVQPDAAPELLAAINELPGLALRGLMTIPAPDINQATQREPFRQLKVLMDGMAHSLPQLDTLSMGMSGDLEAAVGEGASMVRIGTDIFGARYN